MEIDERDAMLDRITELLHDMDDETLEATYQRIEGGEPTPPPVPPLIAEMREVLHDNEAYLRHKMSWGDFHETIVDRASEQEAAELDAWWERVTAAILHAIKTA